MGRPGLFSTPSGGFVVPVGCQRIEALGGHEYADPWVIVNVLLNEG
jgi:hypothetical protein